MNHKKILFSIVVLISILLCGGLNADAKSKTVIRSATVKLVLETNTSDKYFKETVNVRIPNKEGAKVILKGPQVKGYSTSQTKVEFIYHNGHLKQANDAFILQKYGGKPYKKNVGLGSNIKGAKVNFHGHRSYLMNINKNMKFNKKSHIKNYKIPFDFHFNTKQITYKLFNIQPYYKKAFDIAVKRFNKENKIIKLRPTNSNNALATINYKYNESLKETSNETYTNDKNGNLKSINITKNVFNMKGQKFQNSNGWDSISSSLNTISSIIGMKSSNNNNIGSISVYNSVNTHLSNVDILGIKKAYGHIK